ncbi:MAG TPA: polysaccharide biosynthesis tyrosine autokinase [Stenomitos sp.]
MEEPVQQDFLVYWLALRRRWLPALLTFSVVLGMTIVHTLLTTPVYRITGKILYEQDDKASSLIALNDAAKALSPSASDPDRVMETALQIATSQPVLQQTLNILESTYPHNKLPDLETLRKKLTIKNDGKANIIQISYDGEDTRLAVSIVNELMQVYLQNNLQTTRASYIAARKFISAQLPEVKQTVFRADLALRQFQERYKLTDLEIKTKSNAESISRIDSQVDQAETQLASLSAAYQNLQRKLDIGPQDALALSKLSQSPSVQASLTDLQTLERQLEQARAQYQDSNPIILDLQAKLERLKALLNKNVSESLQNQGIPNTKVLQVGPTQQDLLNTLIKTEIDRSTVSSQLDLLNQLRSQYLRESGYLPALQQRERELRRELSVAESTYQALLKSLQEVRVNENQTVGNVRIIEPAQIPLIPIAPNKKAALAAGGLVGLLLAAAVVYLLESFDTRLKRIEQVRSVLNYILLGTIPIFPPSSENEELAKLPVLKNSKSSVSEAYRVLQANLKFLQSDKPLKVIAVTSSIAKEGKSTTCANLAAVLHQMGHRVLLVDLDLRRPTQHQIWEINNVLGISDFLAGQIQNIDDVSRIVEKGLEVVTSGTLPPNPLALIDSVRLASAIRDWSLQYDYIILDTPPLSVAADAAVISKISDGLVLIARPDYIDKKSAQIVQDYILQSGVKILGLVVNGIIPKNEFSYYYYHSQYSYYTSNQDENIFDKRKNDFSKDVYE